MVKVLKPLIGSVQIILNLNVATEYMLKLNVATSDDVDGGVIKIFLHLI